MSTPVLAVTVVIPTRNRATLLNGCIESLVRQDFPSRSYEIIVVNDGSTDDTIRTVDLHSTICQSPSIRCVSLERVGVNGARNAGIRAAAGDVVCIIDDDEVVQRTHLRSVVDALEKEPELDGVGGPYRPFSRSRVRTCRRCSLGASDLPGTGKRRTSWLIGGNMAIRKSVFSRRGLFDEELSGFGDEYEWFHRGPTLRLLFDPDLWVWHRRDYQTLRDLCISAWSQGLAIPLFHAKQGINRSPSTVQFLRYLGHGITHLCASGVILACREAAALRASWTFKRRRSIDAS